VLDQAQLLRVPGFIKFLAKRILVTVARSIAPTDPYRIVMVADFALSTTQITAACHCGMERGRTAKFG